MIGVDRIQNLIIMYLVRCSIFSNISLLHTHKLSLIFRMCVPNTVQRSEKTEKETRIQNPSKSSYNRKNQIENDSKFFENLCSSSKVPRWLI